MAKSGSERQKDFKARRNGQWATRGVALNAIIAKLDGKTGPIATEIRLIVLLALEDELSPAVALSAEPQPQVDPAAPPAPSPA